jgi:hypothetical protein
MQYRYFGMATGTSVDQRCAFGRDERMDKAPAVPVRPALRRTFWKHQEGVLVLDEISGSLCGTTRWWS